MAFAPDCPMCLQTEITTLRGRVAYLEEELRLRDRTAVDVLRRASSAQADADDKFRHLIEDKLNGFSVCYCSRLTPIEVLKTHGCTHWYYDPVTKTNQPNRRKERR